MLECMTIFACVSNLPRHGQERQIVSAVHDMPEPEAGQPATLPPKVFG